MKLDAPYPKPLTDIDADWMGYALSFRYPRVRVDAVTPSTVITGTATKARASNFAMPTRRFRRDAAFAMDGLGRFECGGRLGEGILEVSEVKELAANHRKELNFAD